MSGDHNHAQDGAGDNHDRSHSHNHSHGTGHEHSHGHTNSHGSPTHSHLPSDPALRVKAMESLLTQKGLVDPAALDALIDAYQNRIGPQNGARVVARAWFDPTFRDALLGDATKAIGEMGFSGLQGEHMVAVENSEDVHNVVVCTLCSCYPWSVLGIPPVWYKSEAYRSRVVIDPRGVLKEFGVDVPESRQVRVWDSTAEIRYLVIPQRPQGSEGMSEEQLARLVTRDSMVGTGLAKQPGA